MRTVVWDRDRRTSGGMPRRWLVVTLAVLLAVVTIGGATLGTSAAQAGDEATWTPPRTVYVEAAGHTVDGLFLDLWRAYPDVLGDPITEEFTQTFPVEPTSRLPVGEDDDAETERIVQYFEGMALVYLPDEAPGEQVETLPIGERAADILNDKYPKEFAEAPDDACGSMDAADCVRFEETGHSLHTGFKAFWEGRSGAQLLGMPVSEEFRARDGRSVQFFERGALQWKRGEEITVRPIGRELAIRDDLDMDRIDRPADVPAYDESLFIAPEPVAAETESLTFDAGFGPGPIQGGWKEIVISISAQRMWAYEDSGLIVTTLVSTGTAEIPFTVTPVGRWSVLSKYDVQTMRGTVSGEDYEVPDVPWIMYFDNLGNALHGTYWHDNFGTPMSHGCVNLPLDVAEFLYGWTPLGTPVTVVE